MRPVGEGSIKKAAALLEGKLAAEGLFDPERKRPVPYPPQHIGLVTSGESAAYRDFIKVLDARWGGIEITLVDVQVQGDASPAQVTAAIEQLNQLAQTPDVIVVTRGGGSAEDLQAFSTEQVTRAVAVSRIPTIVAIGHEVDISLAELAADQRASTPSNAAELLVPDRRTVLGAVAASRQQLAHNALQVIAHAGRDMVLVREKLQTASEAARTRARQALAHQRTVLAAYDPHAALRRGYALVRSGTALVRSGKQLEVGMDLSIELHDSRVNATVKDISMDTKGDT
jgi:exodeoxyribonuclease VII large subunit